MAKVILALMMSLILSYIKYGKSYFSINDEHHIAMMY